MSAGTPPTQKRRLPASPSLSPGFFQPKPQILSWGPSRANGVPRPQSPQESFLTAPFGYPSPNTMSPTSPLSFSPHLRHLSPAPSSGVSSVKSMSEHESSDEEVLPPTTQNLKVHLPDPESESETEGNDGVDIDIDLMDPTTIPLDLKSDTASLFSERIFSPSSQKKSAIITIEELPALPMSPALSRTYSSQSAASSISAATAGHVSWQDSGIEVIQGEYSSCASDSELDDTTDDPQTEDDDDFEWNVDVCSSSYPTDDFLLGGFLGLSTGGTNAAMMGIGMAFPKAIDRSFNTNVSARPATPFTPRKTRGYATIATPSVFTQNLEKAAPTGSANSTLKRRSLNTPNTKKRRRIYSLFDDKDGEGDDESDEAESSASPAKRVKGRMNIDSVLNGGAFNLQQQHANPRRGSLSQMFGVFLGDDMDVDL
ncbi:uncharacterized protein DFL_000352 [Arthrobotrys flagrans]|uniref:Uncharacterized protein n=1 Tax=Arthrobotrys flagrans TaxID=97331 RepID=A0A437ADH5_ARTFL|nr:hypothetical protein DFL_000352 [Arthrobotrys flagrans]